MNYPYISLQHGYVVMIESEDKQRIWNPLQNIADAWMIVEKMKGTNYAYQFALQLEKRIIYGITPEVISKTTYELIA